MDGIVKESVILETTAVFSEDQTKRYELTKEFKPFKNGKSIAVIMLNAATRKVQETDATVNNLVSRLSTGDLVYSKITILNLFPDIMPKLIPSKTDNADINFKYIKEVLERGYDNILVGYGNSFIGNKVVENAKYLLNDLLKDYEKILVEINDEANSHDCSPMHPLFAAMRIKKWVLKPYRIPQVEQPSGFGGAGASLIPSQKGLKDEGMMERNGSKKKAV